MTHTATTILLEKLEQYAATSTELLQLQAIQKTSGVVAYAVTRLVLVLIVVLLVVFLSIAAALWISGLVGNYYGTGFFVLAVFYAIVLFVWLLFCKQMVAKKVKDGAIQQMLSNKYF